MTPYETLLLYRNDYPDLLTPAQIGELMNRVAWDYRLQGMALLGKAGGSNVPMPNGELISSDYLVHVPSKTGHDVLTNNPSRNAIPLDFTWGKGPEDLAGYFTSGERTIALPVNPMKVPPAIPPLPIPANTEIETRLKKLEEIVEQNGIRMEAINSRFAGESANLNVHKPLPEYVGKGIFGTTVKSHPNE